MDKVYLAIPNLKSDTCSANSQIFTDEITLASYIQRQFDCYLFTGLKKISSVETTVIEDQ